MSRKKPGPNKKPGPKPFLKVRHPDRHFEELTPQQNDFVEAYADPENPAFRNATEAALQTYNTVSRENAQAIGSRNMKKPKVQKALRELLCNDRTLKAHIVRGLRRRLSDPDPNNKAWQPAADFYAKIKGEFAPEKSLNINLNAEEKQERLERIRALIEGQQEAPAIPTGIPAPPTEQGEDV